MNKLLKRLLTRETTRGLLRIMEFCLFTFNAIKIGSLKSTDSAKRRFKIERITSSGMAMRNKQCMFKNIDVSRAKRH